jgi:hypothetical protein
MLVVKKNIRVLAKEHGKTVPRATVMVIDRVVANMIREVCARTEVRRLSPEHFGSVTTPPAATQSQNAVQPDQTQLTPPTRRRSRR